jgi:hypothetical protein
VGPFDFDEDNRIPNQEWDKFKEKAAELNLDVSAAFNYST